MKTKFLIILLFYLLITACSDQQGGGSTNQQPVIETKIEPKKTNYNVEFNVTGTAKNNAC